jgi:hypothetical protein
MVLCFSTGQKARKALENGYLSRRVTQMPVSDLVTRDIRAIGDLKVEQVIGKIVSECAKTRWYRRWRPICERSVLDRA